MISNFSHLHIQGTLLFVRPTACQTSRQQSKNQTNNPMCCAVAVSASHVSRALLYFFLLGCDDIEFERESQSNRVEKRGGITTSKQAGKSVSQAEEVR